MLCDANLQEIREREHTYIFLIIMLCCCSWMTIPNYSPYSLIEKEMILLLSWIMKEYVHSEIVLVTEHETSSAVHAVWRNSVGRRRR
jgi:hypothetical protein